jgi:hypothetical protein
MIESTVPPTSRRPGRVMIMITVIAFALAAVVGAYLDWRFWVEVTGGGLLVSLVAIVILVTSGLVAVLSRRVRRIAIVAFAVGLGVIAGQVGGPSREPQIVQTGTMTIHLTSPFIAVASGAASCQNVASGTEFQVGNDENARFDTSDGEFVSVFINKGDRWEVLSDAPRKDGVRLDIRITPTSIPISGKPGTSGMQADSSSPLTSTFSNTGGSIQFSNLVVQTGADFSGEAMNLAGTIDWTCDAPAN